jgi:hypothetical protein
VRNDHGEVIGLNDHWAEYYFMGALLAHTVVLVLDGACVSAVTMVPGRAGTLLRELRAGLRRGGAVRVLRQRVPARRGLRAAGVRHRDRGARQGLSSMAL